MWDTEAYFRSTSVNQNLLITTTIIFMYFISAYFMYDCV